MHDADLGREEIWGAEHVGRGVFAAVEVEIVERIAGGVDLRDVQGVEIVEVIFHLRPFGDREAHAGEKAGKFVDGLGDNVE